MSLLLGLTVSFTSLSGSDGLSELSIRVKLTRISRRGPGAGRRYSTCWHSCDSPGTWSSFFTIWYHRPSSVTSVRLYWNIPGNKNAHNYICREDKVTFSFTIFF